jgi:hypothetical protein
MPCCGKQPPEPTYEHEHVPATEGHHAETFVTETTDYSSFGWNIETGRCNNCGARQEDYECAAAKCSNAVGLDRRLCEGCQSAYDMAVAELRQFVRITTGSRQSDIDAVRLALAPMEVPGAHVPVPMSPAAEAFERLVMAWGMRQDRAAGLLTEAFRRNQPDIAAKFDRPGVQEQITDVMGDEVRSMAAEALKKGGDRAIEADAARLQKMGLQRDMETGELSLLPTSVQVTKFRTGQESNVTAEPTGCHVIHLATGVGVQVGEHRSYVKNSSEAIKALTKLVIEHWRSEAVRKLGQLERERVDFKYGKKSG